MKKEQISFACHRVDVRCKKTPHRFVLMWLNLSKQFLLKNQNATTSAVISPDPTFTARVRRARTSVDMCLLTAKVVRGQGEETPRMTAAEPTRRSHRCRMETAPPAGRKDDPLHALKHWSSTIGLWPLGWSVEVLQGVPQNSWKFSSKIIYIWIFFFLFGRKLYWVKSLKIHSNIKLLFFKYDNGWVKNRLKQLLTVKNS